MRNLILVNKGADLELVKQSISKLKEDYKQVGITASFYFKDTHYNLEFEEYSTGNYGLKKSLVSRIARDIKKESGDKYDLITIMISEDKWVGDNTIGWNMGKFYGSYHFQQVKVTDNHWTKDILAQELMHSWDNFAKEEGISLSKMYGVRSFDEDIVHARQFDYDKTYIELAFTINSVFRKRKERYENKSDTFFSRFKRSINRFMV